MTELTQISFDVSPEEAVFIGDIAQRARKMAQGNRWSRPGSLLEWRMDITAVHANGNPLRLEELAGADDFNFAHDVFGIARHLDRGTGELRDFFRPRYSQPMTDDAARALGLANRKMLEHA